MNDMEQGFGRLLDERQIERVLRDYARGVDRLDMPLLRSAYHDEAIDDHGDYRGPVDGFVAWLSERHTQTEHSMHFLGNCHIEFFTDDVALVETYFASRRLANRPVADRTATVAAAALFDEKLGRYVDRFERRGGLWKIAHRVVVFEVKFTTPVRVEPRAAPTTWGRRDAADAYASQHRELVARYGEPRPAARPSNP
jgi:hypothetical protein